MIYLHRKIKLGVLLILYQVIARRNRNKLLKKKKRWPRRKEINKCDYLGKKSSRIKKRTLKLRKLLRKWFDKGLNLKKEEKNRKN